METTTLLYIALIIYLLTLMLAMFTKITWLYMIAGLLWFIPLLEIDNIWIKIVSVVLMLAHFTFALTGEKDDF